MGKPRPNIGSTSFLYAVIDPLLQHENDAVKRVRMAQHPRCHHPHSVRTVRIKFMKDNLGKVLGCSLA